MKDSHNYLNNSLTIAVFLVFLFIICFGWFYIQPVENELHQDLLRLTYLGWSGMNLPSFFLGVIQSFLWGFIFTAVWNMSKLLSKFKS